MPRFGHLNPHELGDPDRAQLVQAYMVLQAKQLSVQKRLSLTTASSASSSGTSSPDLSPEDQVTPATSRPPRMVASSPRSPSRRAPYLRRPSVPSIPETPAEHVIDTDEGKLFDINQRIKITLMELLNCESVKKDERMRAWVQSRLDAQPPLSFRRESSGMSSVRSERRKSSLSTSGDWTPSLRGRGSPDDDQSSDQIRKLSL